MRTLSLILSLFMLIVTALPAAAMQGCAVPGQAGCESHHQPMADSEHPGHVMGQSLETSMLDMSEHADQVCLDMSGCATHCSATLAGLFSDAHLQADLPPLFFASSPQNAHLFPDIEPPIR